MTTRAVVGLRVAGLLVLLGGALAVAPALSPSPWAQTVTAPASGEAVPNIPTRPEAESGATVVAQDEDGLIVVEEAPSGGTPTVIEEGETQLAPVPTGEPGLTVESQTPSGLIFEGGEGGEVRVERLGGADLAPTPEGATAPVRVTEDRLVNDPVRPEVRDPTRFYGGVDTVPFWDEIRSGDRTSALQVLERMRAANPGWTASPTMLEALAVDTSVFWQRINAGDREGASAALQQLRRDNPDWYPTSNMIEALTRVDTRPFWERIEANDRTGARQVLERLRSENPDWVPDRRMMEALTTVDTRPFWERIEAGDRAGAREALRALRQEYADWAPTPDMLEALQVDTRPFWAEVRAGDLAGAQAALETLKAGNDDWQPSDDILQALDLMRLSDLAAKDRYQDIVALAGTNPDLFSCSRIEANWWLADAHAALGNRQALSALYRRLLTQCPAPSPEDLGITLQKASTQLPTEEFAAYVQAIDAAGWPVEARQRYQQATQGLGSRQLQDAIESGNVTAVERVVAENPGIQRDPALTNLIGYFLLNKRRPAEARPWFERSLSLRESFDARQGLVLALARSGDLDRAAELASAAPEKRTALQTIVGDAYADAATAAARRGDREEARALTEKAAALGVRRRGPSAVGIGYQRLNSGNAQGALERFVASYKSNPTPASATGIALALQQLGRIAEARQMACGWAAKAANLAQLCQDFQATEAAQAFENSDYDAVIAMATAAGPSANVDLRSLEGWSYYNLDQFERAETIFEAGLDRWPGNEDMLEGLARTRVAMGRPDEAMDLACPRAEGSAIMAGVCADAAGAAGTEFADDRDWQNMLRTAEMARASGAEDANLSQMEGWALLRLGRPQEAAARFEEAYRQEPSEGAGTGLLQSLEASGDMRRARALTQEFGGELAEAWRVRVYDTYMGREQYLAAYQALGDEDPALRGLNGPEVVLGGFFRSRSGDDGMDGYRGRYAQLQITDAFTGFNGYASQWGLRFESVDIDIGDPAPNDDVGSRGRASAVDGAWVTGPSNGDTIFQVYADYRHEAPDHTLDLSLGAGPFGGVEDAVPLGSAKLTVYGDGTTVTGRVFAEPRVDSLLSHSGMVDPYTGQTWGRVVETGVRGDVTLDLSDRWSASAGLYGSYLRGENVEDNYRMGGVVAVGYELEVDDFEHVRVGPQISFQSYDQNLSEFTYGHGGYFSPQNYSVTGVYVDFLTANGRKWQVGGRAFAGWSSVEEDSTPVFPTNDDGQRYPSTSNDGIATELELRGALQVAPHWQLGGLLRHSMAPDYHDTAVGMTLRYSFEERDGVFTRDFPSFIDRGRQ